MNSLINFLYLADIHFGNPRVDPAKMYEALCQEVLPKLEHIKVLFFCGDLFDNILMLEHPGAHYALMFINEIIMSAKKYGFKIRFVRGTFTHDRNQQGIIQCLNKFTDIDCKVINDIQVEKLVVDDTEFKIVYLPDSLSFRNSKQVIEHIKELFILVGWDKCDMIVGHGTFIHCNPAAIKPKPTHYEVDDFKGIIKDNSPIIMGHIHTPSHYKNVIYVGSFDRLRHGEEEKKGYLTSEYNTVSHKWKYQFHENKKATLFYTITPVGNSKEEMIKYTLEQITKLFPDGYGNVRISHFDPELKAILNKICANRFPNIRYSAHSKMVKNVPQVLNEMDITTLSDIETITIPSIAAIVADNLKQDVKYKDLELTKETIADLIDEIM